MLTFVDGYNLLFQAEPFDGTLQYQREQLIAHFNRRKGDFIIVFDGGTEPHTERHHIGTVEVVFTSGESADDYIINEIERLDRKCLVISSDKGLTRQCRCLGAKTKAIDEFWQ